MNGRTPPHKERSFLPGLKGAGHLGSTLVKFLFICHLAFLAFALGGLLLASPQFGFWGMDAARIGMFRFMLSWIGALQILFGAATMLVFGWIYVGRRRTFTFFAASVLVSFLLGFLVTDKTALLGIFFAGVSPVIARSGFVTYFILLTWFYMGFTSYLLACKLVVRLGLRRQTLSALMLGTYFLVAWDIALNVAITGVHLPAQLLVWQNYSSFLGLPVSNAFNWAFNGLVFLALSRMLWRVDLDARQMAIWLPFGVYTANIGFVMLLNFSVGLWLPLLLSTVLILAPESLAFFPQEEARTTPDSSLRLLSAQVIWWIMRSCSLVLFRRRLKLNAEGVEHIPRSGPVLLAVRHFHYIYDGYILVRTVPRRLHTIVALDWVQIQALRLLIELSCLLAGWLVILRPERLQERAEGKNWAYQVNEGRRYLRQVMRSAARLLRAGEILVIFPEGYPNIDPHPTPKADLTAFLPFRSGFVKMASLAERDGQTQVAIVPAGLIYTRRPHNRWQATVRFGPALHLSDFASLDEAREAIESHVQALSYAVSPVESLDPPVEPFPS